jgi:hypothetical protein
MLAERRDFTVATYSSTRGTGARLTVSVLTGSGCGAGCFAWVSLHPELVRTASAVRTVRRIVMSLFKLPTLLKACCTIEMLTALPEIQAPGHPWSGGAITALVDTETRLGKV